MPHKKLFIIIIFACMVFACKKEVNTTFSEISFISDNDSIISVNLPYANGNSDVSNKINSEIKQTTLLALHVGDSENLTNTSIEKSISGFIQEFKRFKNDFPDTQQHWEAQIDGDVMFKSDEVISVAITSYTNTGGAHGNLTINFLNFNSKTGQSTPNTDLITNKAAFKTVARMHFNKTTKDKALLFNSQEFTLPANIGYSNNGLILLYNTYEIAPYSTGVIEFTIPYSEVNNFLLFKGSH